MEVIKSIPQIREFVRNAKLAKKTVSLVPTMGNLHLGHMSLIELAKKNSDIVILYIFLNPAQFNNSQDFDKYPRTLEHDLELAAQYAPDAVFVPELKDIYPAGYNTGKEKSASACCVVAGNASEGLCGATRPGHYDGVVTVLTSMFNIVDPDVAIFGDKDYQQVKVIEQLVNSLHFPIKIIPAPLIRDTDSLAYSSRNNRLTQAERIAARVIPQSLFLAQKLVIEGATNAATICKQLRDFIESQQKEVAVKIEYLEIVHPQTLKSVDEIKEEAQILIAAFVGEIRLIDNLRLSK